MTAVSAFTDGSSDPEDAVNGCDEEDALLVGSSADATSSTMCRECDASKVEEAVEAVFE